MNNLILLPDASSRGLEDLYKRALEHAVELYIVSAYLTAWDAPAKLNPKCETFRLIVGRDFGITRKEACRNVLSWLPAHLKNCFLVAEEIDGFHPKAMFWREGGGRDESMHSLIGSSNLTKAAFSSNHEANVYQKLNRAQFDRARKWLESIEALSVPVSEDWLDLYREAPRSGPTGKSNKTSTEELRDKLQLPKPEGALDWVVARRRKLAIHEKLRAGLEELFEDCAAGRISSAQFYQDLPLHWGHHVGNRLQGSGWERVGKSSNFRVLSKAFLEIVGADPARRDDIVARQIDRLAHLKVASRSAFFSEMLCLRFPELYPVSNQPIRDFLTSIKFRGPRHASEGAAYVDLAQRLRMALRANKRYPAKNLAELDAVISRQA